MTIVINDASDVKSFLWRWLDLHDRSITFHLIDVGDDAPHVGGGIIETVDDLHDSDAFFDIGYERSDESEISVDSVESYMIGDGEADHADAPDCAVIAQMMEEHPIAFEDFIREYADGMASLCPDYPVENNAQ